MQIEEKTKDILIGVEKLRKHMLNYNEFLAKLGTHLGTTVSTYNRAYKEFAKIEKDTARLTEGKGKIEPKELEKPKNLEE
ncbi:hypothetical protein ES703_10265 [subsurface metagenome]